MGTTSPDNFPYPDESTPVSANAHLAALAAAIQAKVGPTIADTGWVPLPLSLPAGFTIPGTSNTPHVRVIGKIAYFKGALQAGAFTGGFTAIGNLPSGFPKPVADNVASMNSNTSAVRSGRVTSGGVVQVYSSAATGAFFFLSSLSYPID